MEIVIVSIVLLVGVIYGDYTVSGSGIAEHPSERSTAAPPEHRPPQALGPRRERLDAQLVARHAVADKAGTLVSAPAPSQPSPTDRARCRRRDGCWRALLVLKRVQPAAQEDHGVVEHGERFGLGHRRALVVLLAEAAVERGQCCHRCGSHESRT